MERREMKPCRRDEGHEAAHQRGGSEGEGRALLRRVLVPAVVERLESALRHRPARAVPCQTLEACPVMAMHGSVRVEREAVTHREPSRGLVERRRFDETQALLNGPLLQLLVLVFRPGRLERSPVFLRRAQHASQNACYVVITGRGHRHHRAVVLPQRLRDEEVEVRREFVGLTQTTARSRRHLPSARRKRRDGPRCVATATRPSPTAPRGA